MSNEDVDTTDSENENEEVDDVDDDDEEDNDEGEEDDDDDEEEDEYESPEEDEGQQEDEEELGTVTLATEDMASQPSFLSRNSKDDGNEESDIDSEDVGDEVKVQIKEKDEYEYDTSDEEDIRNTTGNIPMKW